MIWKEIRNKKEKALRGTVTGLAAVSFLTAVFFAGKIYGEYRIQRKNTAVCTSERIAVVNLDKGVWQENVVVNYANVLGALPGEDFIFTSLEDAKSGISNDKYAAYVILPYTFSEDICSINTDLKRSRIQYMMNPRLKDSLQGPVQQELQKYLQGISDNASYMYVDAILEEFHRAQDNAGQVIENDTYDYELVLQIEQGKLLVPLEYQELVQIDLWLEPVDVEKDFEEAAQRITDIEDVLEQGSEQAKEAFDGLEQEYRQALDAGNRYVDYITGMTFSSGREGDAAYVNGIKELESYAARYEEENGSVKERILNRLGKPSQEDDEEEAGQTGTEQVIPQEESVRGLILSLEQELEEQKGEIAALREYCEQLIEEIDNLPDSGTKDGDGNDSQEMWYKIRLFSAGENDESSDAAGEDFWEKTGGRTDQDTSGKTAGKPDEDTSEQPDGDTSEQPEGESDKDTSGETDEGTGQDASEGSEAENGEYTPKETEPETELATGSVIEPEKPEMEIWERIVMVGQNDTANQKKLLEKMMDILDEQEARLQQEEDELARLKTHINHIRKDMEKYNEIDKAALQELIETGIIDPLENQIGDQEEELTAQTDELQKGMQLYLDKLEDYDPLDYVDESEIRERVSMMKQDASNIQRKIEENRAKYEEYAQQVYEAAEENVDGLQNQIQTAYEATGNNLSQTLEETLRAKEQWHMENLQLMESLTQKLLYSRKGRVANQEMYEFVINPIQTERIY